MDEEKITTKQLEEQLTELKPKDVQLPTFRNNLRRALLTSPEFDAKQKRQFPQINSKIWNLARYCIFIIAVVLVMIILVGFPRELLITSPNVLLVKAEEYNQNRFENFDTYTSVQSVIEWSDLPPSYEIE